MGSPTGKIEPGRIGLIFNALGTGAEKAIDGITKKVSGLVGAQEHLNRSAGSFSTVLQGLQLAQLNNIADTVKSIGDGVASIHITNGLVHKGMELSQTFGQASAELGDLLGVGKEAAKNQREIGAAALSANVDIGGVVEGFKAMKQAQVDLSKTGFGNVMGLTKFSKATGIASKDVMENLDVLKNRFGMTDEQADHLVKQVIRLGETGGMGVSALKGLGDVSMQVAQGMKSANMDLGKGGENAALMTRQVIGLQAAFGQFAKSPEQAAEFAKGIATNFFDARENLKDTQLGLGSLKDTFGELGVGLDFNTVLASYQRGPAEFIQTIGAARKAMADKGMTKQLAILDTKLKDVLGNADMPALFEQFDKWGPQLTKTADLIAGKDDNSVASAIDRLTKKGFRSMLTIEDTLTRQTEAFENRLTAMVMPKIQDFVKSRGRGLNWFGDVLDRIVDSGGPAAAIAERLILATKLGLGAFIPFGEHLVDFFAKIAPAVTFLTQTGLGQKLYAPFSFFFGALGKIPFINLVPFAAILLGINQFVDGGILGLKDKVVGFVQFELPKAVFNAMHGFDKDKASADLLSMAGMGHIEVQRDRAGKEIRKFFLGNRQVTRDEFNKQGAALARMGAGDGGLWSVLKARFLDWAEKTWTAMKAAANDLAGKLATWVSSVDWAAATNRVVDGISDFVVGITQWVSGGKVTGPFGNLATALGNAFSTIGSTLWGRLTGTLEAAMNDPASRERLVQGIGGVLVGALALSPGLRSAAVEKLGGTLGDVVGGALKMQGPGWSEKIGDAISSAIGGSMTSKEAAKKKLSSQFTGFAGVLDRGITGLTEKVGTAVGTLGGVTTKPMSMLGGAISKVGSGVGSLTGGLMSLAGRGSRVFTGLAKEAGTLAVKASAAMGLTTALSELPGLAAGIYADLTNKSLSASDVVSSSSQRIGMSALNVLDAMLLGVPSMIGSALGITREDFASFITWMQDATAYGMAVVGDFFGGMADWFVYKWESSMNAIDQWTTSLGAAWALVTRAMGNAWDAVIGNMQMGWSHLTEGFEKSMKGIGNWFADLMDGFTYGLADMIAPMQEKLLNLQMSLGLVDSQGPDSYDNQLDKIRKTWGSQADRDKAKALRHKTRDDEYDKIGADAAAYRASIQSGMDQRSAARDVNLLEKNAAYVSAQQAGAAIVRADARRDAMRAENLANQSPEAQAKIRAASQARIDVQQSLASQNAVRAGRESIIQDSAAASTGVLAMPDVEVPVAPPAAAHAGPPGDRGVVTKLPQSRGPMRPAAAPQRVQVAGSVQLQLTPEARRFFQNPLPAAMGEVQ